MLRFGHLRILWSCASTLQAQSIGHVLVFITIQQCWPCKRRILLTAQLRRTRPRGPALAMSPSQSNGPAKRITTACEKVVASMHQDAPRTSVHWCLSLCGGRARAYRPGVALRGGGTSCTHLVKGCMRVRHHANRKAASDDLLVCEPHPLLVRLSTAGPVSLLGAVVLEGA